LETFALQPQRTLDKLEWTLLTARLANFALTDEAQENCLGLLPNRDRDTIRQRWIDVTSLRDLARSGYKAPIGSLKNPRHVFKGAEKGQILEGPDLRLVYDVLFSTKRVLAFAGSFTSKSPILQTIRATLSPIPQLLQAIEKAVGTDGLLLDSASEELAHIRGQKTSLRKRIEETITRIMHEQDVLEYLQDDFYTVRHDKYVIPLRLDGRGRVKGTIVDTSDSGQSLFLEPTAIAGMNFDLHELDLAEKLEIIRIFRALSAHVARELDVIRLNYKSLIELDALTAEAALAVELDAGAVEIAETPCLSLIEARHPLIKTASGKTAEPNTIMLGDVPGTEQRVLVVSGPNAGGKTVVLKTTGLLHLMARAGLLIPADPKSKMYFFETIHLEMGDGQNITANLSTFSGHLLGLKPILESASKHDLVLLDELATGTEPLAGAAIARAVLEHLAQTEVTTIATTHFDGLKGMAIGDTRYRNASMEYAEATYRPTYRLILDVPGQSYGLELATQMGIPSHIIERARSLRGHSHTALDEAVSAMQRARVETLSLKKQLDVELLEAQSTKARWHEECRLLEEQRAKASRSVAAKLETEVDSMRSEFEDKARELRDVVKEVRTGGMDPKSAFEKKREVEAKLRTLETSMARMANSGAQSELPGTPITAGDLRAGLNVYVLPLKREGIISKIGTVPTDPIEVQVGIVKVRVGLLDLRKTRGEVKSLLQNQKNPRSPQNIKPSVPEFVLPTAANTLDIRGVDVDSGVEKSLTFIDKCMLAGERAIVIIHGNGGDRLKAAVRAILRDNCPYNVSFRPGESGEGGDGVTIVAIG
jgi:DNA mismatch repair protein MutS2